MRTDTESRRLGNAAAGTGTGGMSSGAEAATGKVAVAASIAASGKAAGTGTGTASEKGTSRMPRSATAAKGAASGRPADKSAGTDGDGTATRAQTAPGPLRVRRRWTEQRRQVFLEHVARTCSITHALSAVAMSPGGLYHLRTRDAAFRDQLAGALQMGYEQVEADLLAHVLAHGGTVEQSESGPIAVPAFNAELALKLLQFRDRSGQDTRRNGGPPVKRATGQEIEDALTLRLGSLAKLRVRGS